MALIVTMVYENLRFPGGEASTLELNPTIQNIYLNYPSILIWSLH